MSRTAVVTGATGLVGRELLDELLATDFYDKITVIGRRELNIKDNRIEQVILNLDNLDDQAAKFEAEDHYCALGATTTKLGDKDFFKKVDFDYPLKHAELAIKGGKLENFLVVTSLGANADSPLFYNRIKGEIEEALKKLNIKSLHIFQPSLLLGAREEFRFWEEVAKILTIILSFFIIRLNKFWSIKGEDVAKSMIMMARAGKEGVFTHRPSEIRRMVRKAQMQ